MVTLLFVLSFISIGECDSLYTVKANDTLKEISKDGDWETSYVLNSKINHPNKIFPKQRLYIPCKSLDEILKEALHIPTSHLNNKYLKSYTIQEINTILRVNRLHLILDDYLKRPEKVEVSKSPDPIIEINGLIHDETVTKAGYDFYREFYNRWEPPKNAESYSITIDESPSMGMGTIISVKVNDTIVYRNRIKPDYNLIVNVSSEAVNKTIYYLKNYQYSIQIY